MSFLFHSFTRKKIVCLYCYLLGSLEKCLDFATDVWIVWVALQSSWCFNDLWAFFFRVFLIPRSVFLYKSSRNSKKNHDYVFFSLKRIRKNWKEKKFLIFLEQINSKRNFFLLCSSFLFKLKRLCRTPQKERLEYEESMLCSLLNWW